MQYQLTRLEKVVISSGYKIEFDRELEYINFVATLPFQSLSQDILDLHRATEILDKNHYGLKTVKDRILEYLSTLILNSRNQHQMHSQVLAFVGLVGSGKTSLAYSIAESLGRQIIRIPFGGLGSVKELRGSSRTNPEAEAGQLMKAIHQAGVRNPVILLDEIDRVAAESRADVMGVLVELLDPEQNFAFVDHYVDYPFDFSKVLFVATANNTGNIATAVLDRLEVIEMPAYSDEEKVAIGKNYLLPKAIKEAGVPAGLLSIDDLLWPQVVRPLGFDGGIRSLQRNIQRVVRKVARMVVEGNPGPYHLTVENIGQYLG
ncbi:MAG: AAA family ATPase [Patescibacteria group bacterium]|nr:AAA family ATPase [Patescibacteria group bacterium]